MAGPLDRVRVLDLTSVVMGPYATSILAEFGADVVKIEPPGGEVMRKSGPMRHADMGHFYLAINRNKRSVVLDLKREEARQVLLRMAAASDVLVYNIRPQAMERLGLGYERLRVANPRLLYVGAYGFSQKGPYAARPAYDDLIQGMVGIPWLSQQAGADQPRYAPMVLVDRMVGLQLANVIATGLYHRERSGRGQRIDVPMFEGMLSVVLGEHLAGRQFEPAVGPAGYQRSLARDRRPYRTKDGWLCAMVYNDKQWRTFFDAIGRPEVFANDERFHSQDARLTHIDHVYGFLADVLATRTCGEWLRLFERADIPAARMAGIEDMLADEHVQATGFVREVDHPTEGRLRVTAIPTEWSESVPQHRSHAPLPGENTREVLREFGIASDEIEALVNSGAASQAQP
ncbi:MAG: CoA transferase [Burkholderiales bacterium]|nr:CoA transferase [Burkholderiales bacterium]